MIEKTIYRIYGNSGVTNLSLFTVILLCSVLLYLLSKRGQNVIYLILVLILLIPQSQKLVIAGLDLSSFRLINIIGWINIVFISKKSIQFNRLDKFIIFWAITNFVMYFIQWRTIGAIIFKSAFLFDTLGIYFLFRFYINSKEHVDKIIIILVFVSMFLAISMLIEQFTTRNLFYFLGQPEYSQIRNGRLRAQGPFQHAILAGVFGATLMPAFFILLLRDNPKKLLFIIGFLSSTIIVIASSSTTPLFAYISGGFALLLWPLHNRMKIVRWFIILGLVATHLYMKAPIWALIARINVTSGNSSYHRYLLIDAFINNIKQWWIFGTKSTFHWAPSYLNMHDVSNRFVTEGVNGGLLGLFLFLLIIVKCYRIIGLNISLNDNIMTKQYYWILGTILFSHLTAYFGVNYFDQLTAMWYLILAIISFNSLDNLERKN